MMQRRFAEAQIQAFGQMLEKDERSQGTVGKYLRDVRALAAWLDGREASKENTAAWREHLLCMGYAPATINSMLSAANRFYCFLGWRIAG